MPNPAHVGSCHGDRSPDIFPGRKPNLGCYEGTCGFFFVRWDHSWLTGDLKDPRMKDLLRVRAQCVHGGPQNPTHPPHVEDKHRHFNIVLLLLKKKNYSVTFLCFFPLVSTSPRSPKESKGVNVCAAVMWPFCVALWKAEEMFRTNVLRESVPREDEWGVRSALLNTGSDALWCRSSRHVLSAFIWNYFSSVAGQGSHVFSLRSSL